MAQNPTPEQIAAVQNMMASVEVAYQATLRSRRSIETLAQLGQLKCRDVQNYNLQSSAVWAYQSTAARLIVAGGGVAPAIPDPVYITWKGVPGDQAADIDCNAAGNLSGPGSAWKKIVGRATAWMKSPSISGADIEWRTGPSVADQKLVANAVAKAVRKAGPPPRGGLNGVALGLAPLAVFAIKCVLVGALVVLSAWAVTSVLDAFHDVPGKQIAYDVVAIQAEQNDKILTLRTACYTDCSGRGRDPAACAKSCGDAYPPFKPSMLSSGMGILGTVAGVAVVGVVGYGAYRFMKSRDWSPGGSGSGGGAAVAGWRGRLPSNHRMDSNAIDAEAS